MRRAAPVVVSAPWTPGGRCAMYWAQCITTKEKENTMTITLALAFGGVIAAVLCVLAGIVKLLGGDDHTSR